MSLDITTLSILAAVLAVVIGYGIGAAIGRSKNNALSQDNQQLQDKLSQQQTVLQEKEQKLDQLYEEQRQLERQAGELAPLKLQVSQLREELVQWQGKWQQAEQRASQLRTELEANQARFDGVNQSNEDKIALLQQAEQRLTQQFENLANKIFEQKTEKFSQANKQGLDAILTPLKEQIDGFKKQVNDQYVKEGQERASLKTEILTLKELNQRITEDAAALTKALKGDNKQQGNWGEVVLSKILDQSGLREGHEFHTQSHLRSDEGKAFKPDVIVDLPQQKQVIIDSKVSLSAYERYFNEQDDSLRDKHLSEHVASIRSHIKELGKKDYQKLEGVKTLDYILMFIPIEPAFLLALDKEPDLVKLALDNNIMLVSPTNLLVALRTINNIWQYEYQNQNAQQIAKKAADLYDKFVAFSEDMLTLGRNLETVQKRYDGAMNKLSEGRGNLVRRAEEFRTLGVQSSKKLDQKLLEADSGTEEQE